MMGDAKFCFPLSETAPSGEYTVSAKITWNKDTQSWIMDGPYQIGKTVELRPKIEVTCPKPNPLDKIERAAWLDVFFALLLGLFIGYRIRKALGEE